MAYVSYHSPARRGGPHPLDKVPVLLAVGERRVATSPRSRIVPSNFWWKNNGAAQVRRDREFVNHLRRGRIKKPVGFLAKTLPAEDPGLLAKGAVLEATANLRHPFAPPAVGRLRFEAAILCEASKSHADNAHQAEQKKGRQNKARAVPSPETATPPGRSGSGARTRIGPAGRGAIGQSAAKQKASDGRCDKKGVIRLFETRATCDLTVALFDVNPPETRENGRILITRKNAADSVAKFKHHHVTRRGLSETGRR
jgi:hypothetical protein